MVAKKDLDHTWQCTCGKWNFREALECWKCHKPKLDPSKLLPKKSRQAKVKVND